MYHKRAYTIVEQLALLRERGLAIDNEEEATHFLKNISYYRLAGYWWPMQSDKVRHIFKEGSRFSDVILLYNFDRELRLLVFNAIERIEIGLRTRLIYHLSHEYDPWWFQKNELFESPIALVKTLASLGAEYDRSNETFIKEHRRKYNSDLRFPPAWKILELTSFGGLSKLYGNLKNSIESKDLIAQELGAVNHTYLPSWLQSIAQIRNICAHHGRLWNRHLPGKPKLLKSPPFEWIVDVPKPNEFQHLYIHLCLMAYLLDRISPGHHFKSRLKELLDDYPSVDEKALGLKTHWRTEELWLTSTV